LHVEVVSVEDVCHVSLQSIRQRARKKHITISQTVANKWITFLADNRRLNQILSNLLDNAVKFTPEGGRIGLEVAVDEERQMVHFTVWDTGIGMAPEGLDLLFQPFVQLDDKLSRRYEGAGLGLALVARLTELHGGHVSVESELEKGSRFTVSLPWEPTGDTSYRQHIEDSTPPHDDRLAAARRRAATQAETSHHPEPAHGPLDLPSFQAAIDADELAGLPLILLAEDNEEMVDMLRAYLEIKGYRVVVAFNGKDALELARETRPDLILMDIQMPRMDGLETTRRLRADAELAHIPIIALTALVMPGDRERCLDAGADEYMIKPGSLKKVMQAINAHLQRDSGSS
jgi:CheY-like chemotaxis protein